jgi:ABC-type multidrug transport system permease subunit
MTNDVAAGGVKAGGVKAQPLAAGTLESGVKLESEIKSEARAGERARGPNRDGGAGWSHPLVELTRTRVREFLREPEAVFWVFIFPVLLAFALGIAFRNTAPQEMLVAVESGALAEERTAQIARAVSASPEIEAVVLSPEEASRVLRVGKVALVVRGDASETSNLDPQISNRSDRLDYRYDPTRPESRTARLLVDDALQREYGRRDAIEVREQTVTEPGARYIDFLIPGLIGLNLMGSGLWGLGFAVVNARMRKLLKRLAATPMRRSHFLLSFMLSRLMFLVLEVAAVIAFAWVAFDVAVHGRLIDVAIIAIIGAMSFAGLGLLIAARSKTIEGVSGLMNLAMVPMWLLSGTFFSAERFPDLLQPFIKALPLTALNDSLRSVMSEGAPLISNWPQIVVLIAWGVVCFFIALRIFRWQ